MTKLTENMNKSGVPMTPMVQAIMDRKDIFAFRQEEIPEEIMEAIVKAGYYAPSGHNMQTWKFTVVRGGGCDRVASCSDYGNRREKVS